MYKLTITIFLLLMSANLFCQDYYTGEFSKDQFYIDTETNLPIGSHFGKDDDEGISISIDYGENASIRSIAVLIESDTICNQNFEPNFVNMKWSEIDKGLWINEIEEEEMYAVNFEPSSEVKMHYAGFLETGEPFDNSFIRNKPLLGKLKYFILGFSMGSLNVMPNTIRVIKISPELAYGVKGGGNIPPNSTIYYLIYNLENPRT